MSNDSHYCRHPAEQDAEDIRLVETSSKWSNEMSRSMKTDYREASICSVVSQLVQRKGPFEITVLSKASEAVCGSVVDKSKATDNVVSFFLVSLARIHSVSCLKQRPVYVNNSSALPTGTPTKFSTYKHLSTGRQQLPVRRLHTILHFPHHMNMKRREYHSVKHAANKQRTTQKALSRIFAKPGDCSKNLAHGK